ncbi:response regulator (plasmid) [Burkholderia sp. THE68]|uniref:response regulator n=1 Tax=Burkholderia sp. THE68 TaxID=758782 RepID=UPI0013170DB8|nr:response regulator [Burkholderia sp. THE68]BBU33542.1 response regulator [Burkholderia sp. THE68]
MALALSDMLQSAGAAVLGLMSEVQEALSFVEEGNDVDAAILDVDLHGEKSYPVARALVDRRIHFVFATGYGEEAVDQAYRAFPRVQKPFDEHALVRALLSSRSA